MWKRLKLREKMLISILGVSIVMISLILVAFSMYTRHVLVKETQLRAQEKLYSVSASMQGFMNEKAKVAWTYCELQSVKRWLRRNTVRKVNPLIDREYAEIENHLRQYAAADADIKYIFLASERTQYYYDASGRTLPDGYQVGSRRWYREVAASGKPRFDVDVDLVDQTISLTYEHPIFDDGKFLGIGGVDIDMTKFQKYLGELNDVFKTGTVFLVDAEGRILVHPNSDYVLRKKLSDLFGDDVRDRECVQVLDRLTSRTAGIDEADYRGKDHYYISTPLSQLGWTLFLTVESQEIETPVRRVAQTSVALLFVTVCLLVVGILWLTRSMTLPIRNVVDMFKDIAEGRGDLTRRLPVLSEDEIGEMSLSFNQFMDRLHQIISDVKSNAEELAGTTGDVSTTATQLAAGAEEQNAQAAEVASSIQEMAAVMVQNAQNAQVTADIAERATATANKGTTVMRNTQDGMDNIVKASDRTGEIVETMANRTVQISEIIRVIDDIAVQINLLALNAAIEASSAGEHGKGFAVVADEVRQLAIQTKKATREVVKTILQIQEDTRQVADAMNESQDAVAQGRESTSQTETVFQDIAVSVEQAMQMVKQIAIGSEEQRQSAQEISSSVVAISNVTEESARGAEQMANSAKAMEGQADALRRLVAQFKLNH